MSKLRNTPSAPRRGRYTPIAATALVAGSLAASLLAACSSDAHSPTAPEPAKSPAMLTAPMPTTASSSAPNAPWNSTDAGRQLSWSTFNLLLPAWRTQSSDVQPGTRLPSTMQCLATQGPGAASRTLSPSAYPQSIAVGRTTVTFPAGSVPSNVTVSLNASYSSTGITFDLQPHGYKFSKAIQIDANYNGCSFQYSSPLNMFYLNDSGGIIQTMPSNDDRGQATIHAMTDHFSRYMVAWS